MGDSTQTGATAQASAQPAQTNYGGMSLTALGGLTSSWASLQAARYNRRQADFNASRSDEQAVQAKQTGDMAANRVAGQARVVQGNARAAMAAGGTVVGAGTNAAVLASNEAAAAMDQNTIRTNALREAFGFRARAVADRQAGRMAEQAGPMQAISTGFKTLGRLELESDPRYPGARGSGIEFDNG